MRLQKFFKMFNPHSVATIEVEEICVSVEKYLKNTQLKNFRICHKVLVYS